MKTVFDLEVILKNEELHDTRHTRLRASAPPRFPASICTSGHCRGHARLLYCTLARPHGFSFIFVSKTCYLGSFILVLELFVPDAMQYSMQRQSEASSMGFDWPDVNGVACKIDEELQEIRDALGNGDLAHARMELGDLLLACVNLARFIGADPSRELIASTDRFAGRVDACVALLRAQGRTPRACSLEELDAVWASVKHHENPAAQEGA